MKKILALVLALILACSFAAVAEEKLLISMISKGDQHAFWQTAKKGAFDAGEDFNAEVYYYGPPTETDIALQVESLNGEIQKQPDAIALAALSTESVKAQLMQCAEMGIPVIGFDSGVPDAPAGSVYATASTNNQNAAMLAADEMIKMEGFVDALKAGTAEAPAVVAILAQDATSESITSRTTGFVKRMGELAAEYNTVSVEGHETWANKVEGAGVIIRVEVPASAEVTDVTNASNAILNTDGIFAVFCANEGAVTGFLAATSAGADLAEGGAYEGLIVAGFDAGAAQMNAVRQGWFKGSITQDPYRIGYLAVELAAKAARGEEVADVDTGAKWYTAENIDDPEIAMLLYE